MIIKVQRSATLITASVFMLFLTAGIQMAFGQTVPAPTETVEIRQGQIRADLYISKADTNAPGLRHPVLFVEGFDLYNNQNWEELYTLFNQQNLIEDLKQQGRDVIIMNFGDATIDLYRNSYLMKKAFDYIGSLHDVQTEKFTLIGASMGGLISRLGLAYYDDGMVDTWISFDVPHEGANVPLGCRNLERSIRSMPMHPPTSFRSLN